MQVQCLHHQFHGLRPHYLEFREIGFGLAYDLGSQVGDR
jgi:hypothetical protein